jgi:transcriptional regulator
MAGSDLFTGSLDLLILKALSWGPMHGYAIGLWLRQQSDEALPIAEGALYPALHRLERQGHLEEEWGVTDTNRDAKFYRLTRQGRQQLRTETERWRRYSRIMHAALNAARP